MSELIHKEESYNIIGACMEVHKELGPGLLEVVYGDALELEFRKRNIPYLKEKKYEVSYKGTILPHHFYADFVVYENIILEIKAKSKFAEIDIAQTLNYIKLAESRLGILVNFGDVSLQYKRLVK